MNIEMNILKALAIIAVVVGHSRGPLVGNVYLYHMALFVFISGYFYKDIYSNNPKKLIIKRFKSLYIPFLKFNLFILLGKVIILDNIILNYGNGIRVDLIEGIKSIMLFNPTDPLISAFWFVKNLFYINIIFCLISYSSQKISKKINKIKLEPLRASMVITIFIFFFFIVERGFLQNGEISYLSRAIILNIFFYFGFLYNKYQSKFKKIFNPFFLILSIIYIALAPRYDYFDTYYFYFVNIPFFIISSLIGIYMNLYFAKLLAKLNKTKKSFSLCRGKLSMDINISLNNV